MLNAVEPGTVVPIHRHPTKDESFVILRGKVRVTTHNDDGSIIEDVVLSQESGNYGVDIPKNVWHKLESLELGSFVFECKVGAFVEHEVDGNPSDAGNKEPRICGLTDMKYLIVLWLFCSYVFIPQRRPKDYNIL